MQLNFDFMGKKWVFWTASVVIILVGAVAVGVRGLQFGLEFRGGTAMDLTLEKPFTVAQVRDVLGDFGHRDAFVQPVEGTNEVLIRARRLLPAQVTKIVESLDKRFGVAATNSIQTVGPYWGRNVTTAAVTALAVSIIALIAYISLRFEYKMALTAVLAILHDILVTVGIYAVAAREITPNTVAALLTILGYSLYDTVVVFHRVKENAGHMGKQTFQSMANDSINQVLIRSVNTSLTTMVPILAMLFFGGATLRDFAFALTVGMVSSSYSSIGIAAPIYAVWKETEPKYAALKRRYGSAAA